MADINFTEEKAKEKARKIEHMKSLSKDGSLPFLALDTWGAHASGSGYTHFYVYADGRFVKEDGSYSFSVVQGDGDEKIPCTEINSKTFEGKLSEEKLSTLKKYLEENVVESKWQMMFDAGVSVTYFKDGNEIVIENNTELFKNVSDLVPFDLKKEGKI
jgi:hypothetical protein